MNINKSKNKTKKETCEIKEGGGGFISEKGGK